MHQRSVQTNDGLLKLFDEALDNAVDNAYRSPPTKTVRVTMDATTFECANDGAHIPIARMANGQWVASSIFFKLFSGSNFDDEAGREAAGVRVTVASPSPTPSPPRSSAWRPSARWPPNAARTPRRTFR